MKQFGRHLRTIHKPKIAKIQILSLKLCSDLFEMISKGSTSRQSIESPSSLSNNEDICSRDSPLPQANFDLNSAAPLSQDKNAVKGHIFDDLVDFFEKVSS